MERRKELNIMKYFNRAITYLVLFLSIFAVCYSVKRVVDYANVKKENEILGTRLNALKENNNKLEILNGKLKDKDYFSVYVKDKYQYSSGTDSIIPIK